MEYILPQLPFSKDALEPYIDAKTVEVHYGGHHKSYVDNLNKLLKETPQFQLKTEELLLKLDSLPKEIQTPVKNNAGGHANHTLFWSLLLPTAEKRPTGDVAKLIDSTFDNFETFQARFTDLAIKHFSNGWAWLCLNDKGTPQLLTTKDHESPLTQNLVPLLVIDLWEHAYYLKYQNRRREFVDAFWNIVNWDEVNFRYSEFKASGKSFREWRFCE